jgi:large subunit ribosomal protein L13
MGKHKPIWDPSTDCGDYVVVTGCNDLHVTGNKMQQKKYYSHTTRPGSLKSITMEKLMAKWGGGEILKRAVRGMLPKNRLRDDRMARLKCMFRDVLDLFEHRLMVLQVLRVQHIPTSRTY